MGEESQSYEITKQDNFYYLFTLQSSDQNPITVQVELNKVPTEMELDTGASLSLINKSLSTPSGLQKVLDKHTKWLQRDWAPWKVLKLNYM